MDYNKDIDKIKGCDTINYNKYKLHFKYGFNTNDINLLVNIKKPLYKKIKY